ncbi:hypothetical protein [Phaffia rhodozyma]|uniref:Uncharacterized protein n=1 Tax=Phaffia rhodozyma TaxID=264483 RepID=A0A0F7SK47_PHARH|nr:hypothetical protein [Phaffia rhodozyma]
MFTPTLVRSTRASISKLSSTATRPISMSAVRLASEDEKPTRTGAAAGLAGSSPAAHNPRGSDKRPSFSLSYENAPLIVMVGTVVTLGVSTAIWHFKNDDLRPLVPPEEGKSHGHGKSDIVEQIKGKA